MHKGDKVVNLYVTDHEGNEFVSNPFYISYKNVNDLRVLFDDLWEIIARQIIIGDIYLNEVTLDEKGNIVNEEPLANFEELRSTAVTIQYKCGGTYFKTMSEVLGWCVLHPLEAVVDNGFVRTTTYDYNDNGTMQERVNVKIFSDTWVRAYYLNGLVVDWPVKSISRLDEWLKKPFGKRGSLYDV